MSTKCIRAEVRLALQGHAGKDCLPVVVLAQYDFGAVCLLHVLLNVELLCFIIRALNQKSSRLRLLGQCGE